MARRKRRQKQPEAVFVREGVAYYNGNPFTYRVYQDHKLHIVFDGRFAPFASLQMGADTEKIAQEILVEFLDRRIEEITARAKSLYGVLNVKHSSNASCADRPEGSVRET